MSYNRITSCWIDEYEYYCYDGKLVRYYGVTLGVNLVYATLAKEGMMYYTGVLLERASSP